MMGVAYLDGKTPSVLAVRGTYGLMKVDAWMLRNRKLEKVWRWTNERAPFKYHGQGQHSIKTADIDGDGFDEIVNGSIAIDHDGRTMWSTGMGHGDRFYVSDIDPSRPGLEIWYTIEDPHPQNGVSLWDADPLREIVSRGTVSKWKGAELARIEGSVQQIADLAGDWREEIVTFVNGELRVYTTTIPAADRRVSLMQDPLYRNDVTNRSMGYPHVPMTSYFIGEQPRK
jgi:hypothetical protein